MMNLSWNQTEKEYPKDKTIYQLFEEQVVRTPDKIAAVFEDQKLTYAQLNAKANQLARYLRSLTNIQPDTVIAICLERSLEMIIGILAIMKAGGAYCPIDPEFPKERIQHILQETRTPFLLTQSHLIEQVQTDANVTKVALNVTCYQAYDSINLSPYSCPTDLAYVIYTSGTTGKPKGTMNTHTLLVNRLLWQKETYNFDKNSNVLQKTPFVFDVSVWELLLPLISGGILAFAQVNGHKDPDYLYKALEKYKITKLHFVPSMLGAFVDYIKTKKGMNLHLHSVQEVFCSGEALPPKLANDFKNLFPEIKLHNLYGPTEVAIDVSFYNDIQAGTQVIPIGKPIQNIKFYIIGSNNTLAPMGEIGELHISAPGLDRGYLHQPQLTQEKFVPNLFATQGEVAQGYTRLYKTGDLARWLPDGNVEYLGRSDFQVKLRGYRIELAEIENALTSIEGINHACVIIHEKDNDKYLVGYFVAESDLEIEEEDILKNLSEKVPEYMVPIALIKMRELPLTQNGKLDRKALPVPLFANQNTYVAPTTDLEMQLCHCMEEILHLEKVGITDDFFRIGGNSLLAIRFVSAVNFKLGSQISVKDLFAYKTIARLSGAIQKSIGNFIYRNDLITDGFYHENTPFDLTNAQQAYLFGRFDHFEISNTSAHCYSELLFTHFDVLKFEAALNQLIQRHGALRTIFENGFQRILSSVPTYKIVQHSHVSQKELEALRSFLSHKVYKADQWPLFDFELTEFEDQFILHMSYDVLIMDAHSLGIFFKELATLYNSEGFLSPLRINFRDYLLKVNEVRSSPLYTLQERYWVDKLEEYHFDATLPYLVSPSSVRHPKFARLTKTIPQSQWGKIKEKAKTSNVCPTSVVLFAYGQVLCRWSGQSKFCVNLTLFNRLPLHEQVNDILGDFTVLELFNFKRTRSDTLHAALFSLHTELWNDIEHNLFDGIDFQRLIRKKFNFPQNQSLSPIVLTSVLGDEEVKASLKGYIGTGYSISQTSQTYLDNKAYESPEGFVAEWDYVESLFAPDVIQQMHDEYCTLLNSLADADWNAILPAAPLSKQDQEVIDRANNHTQSIVKETLVDLFSLKASAEPERIAVIDSKGTYSYKEIAAYTYQIALYLQSSSSCLVAILSEKGFQQVVAGLGIMQSGKAYLPLHVDWPLGRIERILEEGSVRKVLISQSEFTRRIKGSEIEGKYQWVIIEDLPPAIASRPLPEVKEDDVAYVIFTSGSTGTPKGVAISHKGAVNTLVAVNEKFNITPDDKVLAISELSFDLSVYDIFGFLAAGATVVFPDQDKIKEPSHWLDLIIRHRITVWNSVPQLMQLLIDYAKDRGQRLDPLKAVLLSGDWIPTQLPEQIKAHSNAAALMSLGGATEGSIWSIWYQIEAVLPEWTSIPYGEAMPNQKMYVLNDFREHCPIGVMGEIHIGGMGTAKCYWNNPEKTQESFIDHPSLGRLYKTGDLGKWHRDGYITFQGRKDTQVKLNGYRLELEEINYHLAQLNGIDKAISRVHNNRLLAYVIPSSLKDFDVESFKLAQHGVRNDLESSYSLNLQLDEKTYRRRKSYREFLN
ncbi:MAG: amino acid adenylation domain-containing protein [Chlamydiales bacterium]|nr:amino acid adenylation domain-containing protein [Chlamydiales bacterium]